MDTYGQYYSHISNTPFALSWELFKNRLTINIIITWGTIIFFYFFNRTLNTSRNVSIRLSHKIFNIKSVYRIFKVKNIFLFFKTLSLGIYYYYILRIRIFVFVYVCEYHLKYSRFSRWSTEWKFRFLVVFRSFSIRSVDSDCQRFDPWTGTGKSKTQKYVKEYFENVYTRNHCVKSRAEIIICAYRPHEYRLSSRTRKTSDD